MKKIYLFIAGGLLFLSSTAQTNPNCGNNRFHDYVFPTAPNVSSNIIYGSNYATSISGVGTLQDLKLDVYQPAGDVATNRPLIIIAHGGSFYGGSKTGGDVVPYANAFAKMGYVVASMDYRLGMTNLIGGAHVLDSADAAAAVVRGTHDARAAVRFFRKNAKIGGNTYKIDTNNIFFAGVSAGALMALHLAYMDQLSEFPAYIDTTGVTVGTTTGQPGMHGGIEGLSGSPGYSSKVKAIVDIAGAIADTAWMHSADTPVASFHYTSDATVPFGTAYIYVLGNKLQKVNGSSSVAAKATLEGITHCFHPFYASGHVPSGAYYDTTLIISRNFLEHFTCGTALDCNYITSSGVNEIASDTDFSIYPNPANSMATIDLTSFAGHSVNIELYDVLGRKVKNNVNIRSGQFIINRDNLPRGIYFVNIISEGKVFSKKIIFE